MASINLGNYESLFEKPTRLGMRGLQRRWKEESLPDFGDRLQSEVMAAATLGASIRGGTFVVKTILSKDKKSAKEFAISLAKESALGGMQVSSRVLVARSLQFAASKQGVNLVGKWAGRTFGAAAGLLINTGVDGFKVLTGKITVKQAGLNFSKNGVIAIATAFSGPLGLCVGLSIATSEFIRIKRKINSENVKLAHRIITNSNLAEDKAILESKLAIRSMKAMSNRRVKLFQIPRQSDALPLMPSVEGN